MTRPASGRAQAVVAGARRPEYAFGLVLGFILVALTFQVAAPEAEWSRFVTLVMHGGVLMTALLAAHAHPTLTRVAGVAIVLALVVSGIALIGPGEVNEVAAGIVNLMFIGLTPVILARGLLRDLRDERQVTVRTMFGVLCIYLLVGSFFAFVFGVIEAVGDTQFFARVADPDASDFLYFSFATLTTVGYGDLTTTNELGRSLAIMEALIGQIYLVTVVALIVSNIGRRPRSSGS
ncbi:MAG TPA: potassium channel family protein [Solirubrobacterales bacterium]|nr:potassium channel family protein [Solirubrobacterales bacterium]